MSNPIWNTPAGSLGTFDSGTPLTIQLSASPVLPSTSVNFAIVNGKLPFGLSMNSFGLITGTPTITAVNSFTVKATDNLGNSQDRAFSINIAAYSPQPQWVTPSGSLGYFPPNLPTTIQLVATPVPPATEVTYKILSGNLPTGLSLSILGEITGTIPDDLSGSTIQFCIRATDNLGHIRDRTFAITVQGNTSPYLTTASGLLISLYDSIWTEFNVPYNNPVDNNPVTFKVINGSLPDGLEINTAGLIRGYCAIPMQETSYSAVTTTATATNASNNTISCFSTVNFFPGRTVIFSSTAFGGIIEGQVYYIKSVIDATTFTISATQNGPEIVLTTETGFMIVSLNQYSVGTPVIRTYTFDLMIDSPLGVDLKTYSIRVINQTLPISQGGLGTGFRIPVLYNTRPPTYDIENSEFYRYYSLPPASEYGEGKTYPYTEVAYIGKFYSGEYFAWKALGYNYDYTQNISYQYVGLPPGLSIDYSTGWITGFLSLPQNTIEQYDFSVNVFNTSNPLIASHEFFFSMIVTNGIEGDITWVTPSNLGQIYNGTVSLLKIEATCDVALRYSVVSGSLPPNLVLQTNGDITGIVAWQPTTEYIEENDQNSFTFTVQAYSPTHAVVVDEKTFTLTVVQEFAYPTDTLYIKAAPTISDRQLIASLLDNNTLIPTSYLFRPTDPNFGKADNVTYVHAYGIKSSVLDEYIAAITTNHYWRYITLGSLQTALAKDENGEVIYEVVYSQVIDNLVNYQGVSVQQAVVWPYYINLGLGPWYSSVTNLFTSYDTTSYYTSLSNGSVRTVYPNSLPNMRNKTREVLGPSLAQQGSSYYKLLPLWMTSQQASGNTLGYTPAWVICYAKPYIVVNGEPVTYTEFAKMGLNRSQYQSYAEIIKNNIETLWTNSDGEVNKLNVINFQLDRFTVDKSSTYNWDNYVEPPAWTSLPSGQPVPNPIDSKDFYVLYPRKTILPDTE